MAFTFQNVVFFVFTLFTGRGLRLSKPRELWLQKPYVCDFLLFFFLLSSVSSAGNDIFPQVSSAEIITPPGSGNPRQLIKKWETQQSN
uniref:Uncharacterized protein n=1 Tax=Rhipicephalus microplus TaxID=6941 RepID=A0A6G5A108_RHIMP